MEKREPVRPRVWIIHVAVATALGDTLELSWKRLMEGRSAIRPVLRFPTTPYPAGIAACMEDLLPGGGKSMIFPLIDRVLEKIPSLPEETRLITATTKGPIDLLEQKCRGIPVPWDDFLIPGFVEALSRRLGLKAPAYNISAACASSTVALARASGSITSKSADTVLVVCADLVSEFVFKGFASLQILSARPCMPFDPHRTGLSLGEGAAAILLMDADRAKTLGMRPLAELYGWGIAADAAHITAPARDGRGLIHAVLQALETAGLPPQAVAAVHAHGTGTLHNDRMELAAFRALFGDRSIPIHSVKGAIGHTLGAAGGIELAVSVQSLKEKVLPPTVGLSMPEAPEVGRILPEPQPLSSGCILSTNSGFGGINAAVLIGNEALA